MKCFLENKSAHLAGNIGFPLSSFVSKIKSGDVLVIEVSSHQLVDFDKFKTDISIVTNLTPTHLDFLILMKIMLIRSLRFLIIILVMISQLLI